MISQAEFLSRLKQYNIVTNNKRISYYNIPAAFDIETSSFTVGDDKRAIMYIWMFGIDDMVTYGRTWGEFKRFSKLLSQLLELDRDMRLPIYVHNYSYEFQWIRKMFEWEEVFLLEDRKPAYSYSGGLEFRCSLKLSGGKSLEAIGKDLHKYKVEKLVGNLDYLMVRTPETELTKEELDYCENDIRVLLAYIREKIETEGDITKIPLTNTGYVRNYCRKACYQRWRKYRNLMDELTVTDDEYSQLKRAFQGGFTHANAHYVNQVLTKVGSYDLSSSYPTVMCIEKFPMSRPRLVSGDISTEEFFRLLKNNCCMFDLEMWNVVPRLHQDHPISSSKCSVLEGYTLDNGRVVTAEHLKTTVTEQDFYTYSLFYEPERWSVSNMRVYEKQYLPTPFVKSILKLYMDKTSLKGIDEEKLNYMISKNMINAAYGMMVTAIVRPDIKYVNDNYEKQPPNIGEMIDRYNSDIKRFLYYPWGVWVTAYARANLFSGIVEAGCDYVYADTDSVKLLNHEQHSEYFERYKEEINEKILKAAKYHNISVDEFSPLNSKGKSVTIGLWDFEGVYDKFKTLGAKRYLTEKGGKYTLTVAGVNKEMACRYLVDTGDPFGKFDDGLTVPSSHTKRLILTYIDDEVEGDVVDYTGKPYHFHELSSVHMSPSDYHLSMTDQFIQYVKGLRDFGE